MKQKKIFGFDYTDNEYMKIFMYLLVGGSAAILEWSLFYIFFRLLSAALVFSVQTQTVLTATTMAFALSTLYHYILCNRFVFDSGSRYQRGTEVSFGVRRQCHGPWLEPAAHVAVYIAGIFGLKSDDFKNHGQRHRYRMELRIAQKVDF